MGERYSFKYVKSGPGDLSGPSMIIQTELALTEIGDTAISTAEEALSEAQSAQTLAETADEKAERAQASADQAQATADQAVSDAAGAGATASEALAKAESAQAQCDSNTARIDSLEPRVEALETAVEEVRDEAGQAQVAAANAQATADQALAEARDAQSSADGAQASADKAQETADDAIGRADNAQSSAEGAQETADANAEAIESLTQTVTETDQSLQGQIDALAERLSESSDLWATTYTDDLTGYAQDTVKIYVPGGYNIGGVFSSPFWSWTNVSDDLVHTSQWAKTEDGTVYVREGTTEVESFGDGAVAVFRLTVPGLTEPVSVTVDADGTSLSASADSGTVSGQTVSGATLSFDLAVDAISDGSVECAVGDDGDAASGTIGSVSAGSVWPGASFDAGSCIVALAGGAIDSSAPVLHVRVMWTDWEAGDTSWTSWTAMGGGGGSSVSQAYVTLASDLSSGSAVSTQGVSYTPGSNRLFVYYEGVKLIVGENYSETDSDNITLLFDAESGSTLEFVRI